MGDVIYVKYVNFKYDDLTTDKVYKIVEYDLPIIKIENDFGIVEIYFWYHSKNELNFENVTKQYSRKDTIEDILN